jgi:copper oxidase (laccase) domain-containing protein
MTEQPFALFRQFSDHLKIVFFDKRDPRPHDVQGALKAMGEASAEQVHGAVTTIVRTPVEHAMGADGLVTDATMLALSVRSADCQSFVIYAPKQHVIGVLHVGWRGLQSGAIPALFSTLKGEWGIEPKETFVGAGPSLCQKCSAFSNPEMELPTIDRSFVDGRYADLRGAADAQLSTLGIPAPQRERHPDCTCCHPERYWTYRGGDRGAVKEGERNLLACVLLPVIC